MNVLERVGSTEYRSSNIAVPTQHPPTWSALSVGAMNTMKGENSAVRMIFRVLVEKEQGAVKRWSLVLMTGLPTMSLCWVY